MRTRSLFSVLALALSLVGCGEAYYLTISEIVAGRAADGGTAVTATVSCNEVGVSCEAPCLEARWFPREALLDTPTAETGTELSFSAGANFSGEPVHTVEACADTVPTQGESATVLLATSEALEGDLLIDVTVINSAGGSDLQRVLVQP